MVAYFFSGVRARPRIRPADRSVGIAAARRIKSKWSEDILPSSTQGSLSGGQGTEPLRGLEEPLQAPSRLSLRSGRVVEKVGGRQGPSVWE